MQKLNVKFSDFLKQEDYEDEEYQDIALLDNPEVLTNPKVALLCYILIFEVQREDENCFWMPLSRLQAIGFKDRQEIEEAWNGLQKLDVVAVYDSRNCYLKHCFEDIDFKLFDGGVFFATNLNDRFYKYYHSEKSKEWNDTTVGDILLELIT